MATKVKLIETGAVTGNIIPDGGIATGKLADDAVTTIKISDANITHAKLHTSMDLTGKTVTVATAAGSTNTTAAASTAFVQQELTTLIGGAPGTLDTLNELAAAINDDASYASTLTTALATKLPLAGGTMTGGLNMGSQNISAINNATAVSFLSTNGYWAGGTQRINGSGDLVNIGSISASGTITTTGGNIDIRKDGTGDGVNGYDINFMNSAAQGTDDRLALIRVTNQGGDGTSRGGKLTLFTRQSGSANFNSALILDKDGDATFAGTISSGAITSTGSSTFTSTSTMDINLVANPPELNFEDTSSTSGTKRARWTLDGNNFSAQALSDNDGAVTQALLNFALSSGAATFGGTISSGAVTVDGEVSVAPSTGTAKVRLTSQGVGSEVFSVNGQRPGVSNTGFAIRNETDSRNDFMLDGSGNATFAGTISSGRISPQEHIIFGSNTGYLQFPAANSTAWAIYAGSGTNAPGTQGTGLSFHHWTGSAWNDEVSFDTGGGITLDGRLNNTYGNGNISAPSTSDHSAGVRQVYYDGSATAWYARGIESNTLWDNTDNDWKLYRQGSVRLQWDESAGTFSVNHGTPIVRLADTSSSGAMEMKVDGIAAYVTNKSTNGGLYLQTNNPRDQYVHINGTAFYSESFVLNNGTQYDFEIDVGSEGGSGNSFFVIAGYNHYFNTTYGAHKIAFMSARTTSMNTMINVGDQSSAGGGAWQFTKPSSGVLRVRKTAGTYVGGGHGFITVIFKAL